MSTPLIATTLLVVANLISFQSCWAESATLFSPIRKDESSNLYSMLIYMKTPLQASQLHLDLGSFLPWYDCSRHYKSSSYAPVIYNSSLCIDLHTNVYGNCFDKPRPGCANDTCFDFPQNPVTLKGGMGSIITDKFTLPSINTNTNTSPLQIVLSCTFPNKYSKIYRGLAKGSAGLASLGRFNYSLSALIARGSNSPWIFALCLPNSSNSTGIALFNSAGPYNFSPRIDVSKLLSYTPLILAAKGAETDTMYWYKSPEYYVGLYSFRVGGKVVNLNQTLLALDDLGRGGAKISSSRPYSVLQSSIYKALVDAFVKESASLNLTTSAPVGPFSVCFEADKVPTTSVGPVVPAIDLVFPRSKNFWRIHGSNSMVRMKNAWCLGFVDGGGEPRTSVVIGGHQIEDNLLQFDLERERLGFSSSLLLKSTTCASFDFKSNY
ncbi:probable aspartic proteinase GIP1 [Salvia miltiorrhiza]|uniref:probable aspartic proteinase GIP1 n=1 Tax=Salvia miltiorrhiza TaxID=226208 RepID=UPI0025AC9CC6|nr:probable aspartic proteinase GIP1 [Salvia miltiorrhiza]